MSLLHPMPTRRPAPPLWGTPASAVELTWEQYQWACSPIGQQYYRGFIETYIDRDEEAPWLTYDHLFRFSVEPFSNAPLYLVTTEMAEVAKHAARSMQDQPLLFPDLPSDDGVILLNGAYPYMEDVHGNTIGTCCYVWRLGATHDGDHEPGVFISMWSDGLDPQDTVSSSVEADRIRRSPTFRFPRLQLSHSVGWPFGKSVADLRRRVTWYGENDSPVTGTMEMLRTFTSLITLMRQRIAVNESARLPRQQRREHERQGRTVPEIKVVTLRKHYNPHNEKSDHPKIVDWKSRWIVSGHWRNAWCPSINTHRQVYIAPYVKGPEGKTLHLPDQIYRLSR